MPLTKNNAFNALLARLAEYHRRSTKRARLDRGDAQWLCSSQLTHKGKLKFTVKEESDDHAQRKIRIRARSCGKPPKEPADSENPEAAASPDDVSAPYRRSAKTASSRTTWRGNVIHRWQNRQCLSHAPNAESHANKPKRLPRRSGPKAGACPHQSRAAPRPDKITGLTAPPNGQVDDYPRVPVSIVGHASAMPREAKRC